MAKYWQTRKHECPDCGGGIWLEMTEDGVRFMHRTECNTAGLCENCHGAGAVKQYFGEDDNPPSRFPGDYMVQCGTCNGLGKMEPCRSDAEIQVALMPTVWAESGEDQAEYERESEVSYRNG